MICKTTVNEPSTSAKKGSCFCIELSGFFWASLNASGASRVLANKRTGSYLVRRSQHPKFVYTLSQKLPLVGVAHIRIMKSSEGLYYLDSDHTKKKPLGFPCVLMMIRCWSLVYRDLGHVCLQHPILSNNVDDVTANYVNEDKAAICFHENEPAEQSVREFVDLFVRNKQTSHNPLFCG